MAGKKHGDDNGNMVDQGSVVEWIIAVFAAVLVIGLTLYLAFIAFTAQGGTPRLALSIKAVDANRPGYVVVNLRNEGEASAGDVHIEGRLPDGETGEVVLDYSPAKSSTSATLVFSRPVAASELTLQVKGFSEP